MREQSTFVTEIQYNGPTPWGNIGSGWICMDYVNTEIDSAEEQSRVDEFVGSWFDQTSQRCTLTIAPGDHGVLLIEITWCNSAFSTSLWRAVGEYDAASDCIQYRSYRHWESVSDDTGNSTDYVYYTDGQGALSSSNGNLILFSV